MNEVDIMEITRQALFRVIIIGGPVMLIALIVGVTISLLQALTQVQEMTLTFVPKIVAIFLALAMLMPFMLTSLTEFTQMLAGFIATPA
ncbi:MAG: flagellar biosynthesis protein FliQ [Pseudomonadota bacterium]|nr:flagellar biosynthesis protein FliQ [Pseudomonadota bacterium]